MAVDEGLGATLTLGSSSFAVKIRSITPDAITRDVLDTSHLGTTGYRTKMFADLKDAGGFSIDFFHEGVEPPIAAAPETLTITYPGADTITGTGGCDTYTPGSAAPGELMVASAHFTWTGTPTFG